MTTRIITFLVGDPYKTSFPTVTVRGPYPSYVIKLFDDLNDTVCPQKIISKKPTETYKRFKRPTSTSGVSNTLPGVPEQSEDGEDDDANGHAALWALACFHGKCPSSWPPLSDNQRYYHDTHIYLKKSLQTTTLVGDMFSRLRNHLVEVGVLLSQKISFLESSNTKPGSSRQVSCFGEKPHFFLLARKKYVRTVL